MESATAMDHCVNNAARLKKLHLTIPYFVKPHMNYLTQYVTKRLQKSVSVTAHGINPSNWMQNDDDMAALTAFAESLQKIP